MKAILAILAGALCLGSWAARAQEPALNDAQILAVLTEANDIDIDNAKLAEKKAVNQDVKGFAQRMMADHRQANESGQAAAKRLHLNPQGSPLRETLKTSAKDTMKTLRDMKGADFDQAYIKNEVAMHQQVLDTIDNSLMPSARNEEVKALLAKVRPVIASHLEHAKKVQAELGKGSS